MAEQFNWEQFHKDLDIALAIFIEETGGYPSQTNIIEFTEFSNSKKKSSLNKGEAK